MPAPNRFITSIQTTAYHTTSYLTSPDLASVKALAVDANKINHTREIGDLSESENVFEFPEFGEDRQTRVAGPATGDSFTITFARKPADAKQKAIEDSSNGSAVVIVIAVVDGDDATYYYIRGTKASGSILNPTGDVSQYTLGVAIDQKPTRYDNS